MTLEDAVAEARASINASNQMSQAKASLWVESLEMLLDALEGRLDDPIADSVRSRLTPSELCLLREFGNTQSRNQDLAKAFRTSEQVIRNRFRVIYDKTGMNSRLELYAFLREHPAIIREAA